MNKSWPTKKPELEFCSATDKFGNPLGFLTKRSDTKKAKVSPLEFDRSLFADDAAFIFLSRVDLETGIKFIDEYFTKFGLKVHLGTRKATGKDEKSKTEFMHIPKRGCTSSEADIADIAVGENRFISYCTKFKYLGSWISNDLDDKWDFEARIKMGEYAFRDMTPILLNKKIKLSIRASFYKSLIVNIALWGCESWAITDTQMKQLEVMQNRHVRRMCKVYKRQCKDYHVRMEDLFKRAKIPKIGSTLRLRQLRFLENNVARAPPERLTRLIVLSQAKRPPNFKFRNKRTTIQESYRSTLEHAGLCKKGDSGIFSSWIPRLTSPYIGVDIDENLGLPKGTYQQGRRSFRQRT